MQRDFLKIVFVVLLAFLSLVVASAQGPKEPPKSGQTAKTGTHHHSSSTKPKDSNKASPTAESGREEQEDRIKPENVEVVRRKEEDAKRRAEEERRSPTLEGPTTGDEKGYRWVDLGLSVKWATCNVGASRPEEYGDYFAWGETTTKSNYTWNTYKWWAGKFKGPDQGGFRHVYETVAKYNTNEKYGSIDNIIVLQRGENPGETIDDVARRRWGGKWRMPTDKEFEELDRNCSKKWEEREGVYGMVLTSLKNGNSIFFPAGGEWENGSCHDVRTEVFCWSSTLASFSPDGARSYGFFYEKETEKAIFSIRVNHKRYLGLSVRPVLE